MRLHNLKFFIRQTPRLQKDSIRNPDLSHIMKNGSPGNRIYLEVRQVVLWEMLLQTCGHKPGIILNPPCVIPGFHASGFHYGAEGVNHEFVCLSNFLLLSADCNLLLLQAHLHVALVLVQLNNIAAPALDNMGVKRLMYHIRHPKGICPVLAVLDSLTCNQDDGDLPQQSLLLHKLQHPEPIHDRHNDIKQNQNDIMAVLNLPDSLFAIFRLNQFISILLVMKHFRQ